MCVEIVRIAGRAVVRVLPGEVVGVFAHVERADQHGAGRFEARHQRRVAPGGRPLAVDLRAGARRQPLDVEQVLDRERRASERTEGSPCAPSRRLLLRALAARAPQSRR